MNESLKKLFDLKEASRDLMALGSIPFLILVLIRIWIADNYLQFFQIIFAVALVLLFSLIFKKNDNYSAIMIILAIFTSIFYKEFEYTIFVIIIGLLAFFGMYKYLGRRNVWYGALCGGIFSLIIYLVSIYLPFQNY